MAKRLLSAVILLTAVAVLGGWSLVAFLVVSPPLGLATRSRLVMGFAIAAWFFAAIVFAGAFPFTRSAMDETITPVEPRATAEALGMVAVGCAAGYLNSAIGNRVRPGA